METDITKIPDEQLSQSLVSWKSKYFDANRILVNAEQQINLHEAEFQRRKEIKPSTLPEIKVEEKEAKK